MSTIKMASIGEFAMLCRHVEEPGQVSVSDNRIDGQIILTKQSSGIVTYDINSQKPVQSWSLPRIMKLTSPAMWNKKSELYTTVVNEQDIRTWSKVEEHLEKSQKKHCKFKVNRVLNVDGYEPVVFCKSGGIEFLSNITTSSPPEGHLLDDDLILLCEAMKVGQQLCVACLLKRKVSEVWLQTSTYTSDRWIHEISRVEDFSGDNIVACDIMHSGTSIQILVLGMDGSLQSIDIHPANMTWSIKHLCTIPGVRTYTQLAVVNQSYIALVGLTKEGQDCVGIFNIKFGTLQDCKALPEQNQSTLKIWVYYKHLIVLCGKSVYCYTYNCNTSSIDNILGNISSVTQADQLTGRTISWNKPESPKEKKTGDSIMMKMNDMVQKASSKKVQEFERLFDELLQSMEEERINLGSCNRYTEQIMDLCLSTEDFWPQKVVEKLIQTGAIPHGCVSRLFDSLIAHGEPQLLIQALDCVQEIQEAAICKCLEYFLSCEDSILENAINSQRLDNQKVEVTESCPVCWAKAHSLIGILKLPCNDLFLLQHLRNLPFTHVLALLRYLNYLLVEGTQSDLQEKSLPVLQVVDWICRLIDAHVTQLIISPDTRQILLDLHDVVQSQLQLYEELVILDTLLMQLKEKSMIPRNKRVGQYCIEVLHIL